MLFVFLAGAASASAQFLDNFDGKLQLDPRGVQGWAFFTGDGSAVMNFQNSGKGHATISVDASKDTRGIWWALIRRRVSTNMNLRLLAIPAYALRIESRIRVSHAPRRVNLHLNTQRTTDFHTHLMEFDIPDTVRWHTISMTTRAFDAVPGDTIYGQLALMDWGLEKYHVDLDYFRVDIVKADSAGPDKGTLVPYHPPVPDRVIEQVCAADLSRINAAGLVVQNTIADHKAEIGFQVARLDIKEPYPPRLRPLFLVT